MKILVVGDVHGDKKPLDIAKAHIDEVDKVVFLGDYVDSYVSKWPQQRIVLEDILKFKDENADKLAVLWGNHDHSYISDPCVSGHQNVHHDDIKEFFKKHLDSFDIVFIQDNWIFSHAGVSTEWLENPENLCRANIEKTTIKLEDINKLFHEGKWYMFDHNSYSPTGDCETEGPLWIRPASLIRSADVSYNQVVGHTELTGDLSDRCIEYARVSKIEHDKEKSWSQIVVLIDSPTRDVYAFIDTETNEVKLCQD